MVTSFEYTPGLVLKALHEGPNRLEVGAGLHNLAKVVTQDSWISTWTFSCEMDRSEANGAFDATLGRDGTRFYSDPVTNYPDATTQLEIS